MKRTKKTSCWEKGPVLKYVESVLWLEESLRWERFVTEVGFKPGVKSKGVTDDEWWINRGRRCGRSRKSESDIEKLGWRWRRELWRSWFHRQGEAHRKERSVMRNEDDVGGRASDERWRASAARRMTRDEVTQIWRLSGCEDLVSKWEEFVFDVFSYFEPVKRA